MAYNKLVSKRIQHRRVANHGGNLPLKHVQRQQSDGRFTLIRANRQHVRRIHYVRSRFHQSAANVGPQALPGLNTHRPKRGHLRPRTNTTRFHVRELNRTRGVHLTDTMDHVGPFQGRDRSQNGISGHTTAHLNGANYHHQHRAHSHNSIRLGRLLGLLRINIHRWAITNGPHVIRRGASTQVTTRALFSFCSLIFSHRINFRRFSLSTILLTRLNNNILGTLLIANGRRRVRATDNRTLHMGHTST